MRVTLVHNPEAGSGDHLGEDLVGRLRDAGHDVTYTSTEAASLSRALSETPDVVLAAGGDGTVGAVARMVAVQSPIASMAILPVGTANNVARALGTHAEVEDVVAGLETGTRRSLDIAIVRASWGTAKFVESAGVGAFAAMLRDAEREEAAPTTGMKTPNDRGARLRRILEASRPRRTRVEADGEDLSGVYLLAVALNIAYVGPGLALAPAADPGDGRLDLLLVRDEDREALGAYLTAIARGHEVPLAIPTRRVRQVRLEWSADGHIDDHVWPEAASLPAASPHTGMMVDIEASGTSIPVLVPSAR